jgi:hypothetical protein
MFSDTLRPTLDEDLCAFCRNSISTTPAEKLIEGEYRLLAAKGSHNFCEQM